MGNKFRIFLSVYLFYIRICGFLPSRIDLKTFSHRRHVRLGAYSMVFGVIFLLAQLGSYVVMGEENSEFVDFRDLQVLTKAIFYASVLVITSAIMLRRMFCHQRFFNVTDEIFAITRQMNSYNLNNNPKLQRERHQLMTSFVLKVLYFEVFNSIVGFDSEMPSPGAFRVDVAVKTNLWVINMMTTMYVGAFFVIIYHFKVLGTRITAISEQVRTTQSARESRGKSVPVVDLSFRYCDDIDVIAAQHVQLRRLAMRVQRLFQPLLLLTFLYHWCDFIIQAYLWYITYMEKLIPHEQVALRYVTALLTDLIDVAFLCSVVHTTMNVSAETGLLLQKFNDIEVDQRLDRTVSGKWVGGGNFSTCPVFSAGDVLLGHIARPIGPQHLRTLHDRQQRDAFGEILRRVSDWLSAICPLSSAVFSHELFDSDHSDSIRNVCAK